MKTSAKVPQRTKRIQTPAPSTRTRKGLQPCSIALNEEEYAFHTLREDELEMCWWYECQRERAGRRRDAIMQEAAELDENAESERHAFAQKLELQDELDALKEFNHPWLSLSHAEKRGQFRRNAQANSIPTEPVGLKSELTPLDEFVLRRPGSRRERLEIVVNWAMPDKRITQSFERLVKKLRCTHGTKAHQSRAKETRGRKASVTEQLFQLAVWRCRKAKLTAAKTVEILEPLRRCWHGPSCETMLKKLADMARAGEKMLFGRSL